MPNLKSQAQDILQIWLESGDRWCTFEEILQRLHLEGIYIHAEQLAEFFLLHGLPVELCYVPQHLKEKAQRMNEHYQGDMAQRRARILEPNFVECYQELGLQPLQLIEV
jgi:hypothetical protein